MEVNDSIKTKGDVVLEKYRLDREEEFEIRRGMALYEQAMQRTMIALNGGSAVAFLTLIGAMWKNGADPTVPSRHWMLAAIVAWVLGLAAAAVATDRARSGLRDDMKALRAHRQLSELQFLREEELFPRKIKGDNTVEYYKLRSDRKDVSAKIAWLISIVCFGIGIVLGAVWLSSMNNAPTKSSRLATSVPGQMTS